MPLATRYRIDDELAGDLEARALLAHDALRDQPAIVMMPNPSRSRASGPGHWVGNGVWHQHLLDTYDAGTYRDTPYVVADVPERGTLLDELKSGAAPPDRAEKITRSIVSGVAALHDAGCTHRHVGPATVAILGEDAACLAPAPLARGGGRPDPLGTPEAYRAPELASGEPADAAADVWALGATAYATLTGEPPPRGLCTSGEDSAALRHARPDAPAELAAILERALAADRTQRYASAVEMLAALDDACVTGDVATPDATPSLAAPPWRSVTATLAVGADWCSGDSA
jgi:serine/threonine protein kinase